MAPGQQVEIDDLPAEMRDAETAPGTNDWQELLAIAADDMLASEPGTVWANLTLIFEATLIRRALAATGGRRIEAAQLLGIGRNTITRKIQEIETVEASSTQSPAESGQAR
jgi:two-component system nitrogen regulation response regulator GlnG